MVIEYLKYLTLFQIIPPSRLVLDYNQVYDIREANVTIRNVGK